MSRAERVEPSAEKSETRAKPVRFRWDAAEVGRKTLEPILNPKIWEFHKKIRSLNWVPEIVDVTRDADDWKQLSDGDRHFVEHVLGMFSILDNIVIKNLEKNFGPRLQCMEAEAYLAAQEFQEWIHVDSYRLQAKAVLSPARLAEIMRAAETFPAVKAIVEWGERYLDPELSDGDALVVWAFVEGVIFSGAFCGLQWLRDRRLLPGITGFNEYIARDEGIHCLFTCHVMREQLLARPTQARVAALAAEAVAVTDAFVADALPESLHGMNAKLMKEYVRFQTDAVIAEMGFEKIYGVANPFPSMDKLSLNGVSKANFFELRGKSYQTASTDAFVYAVDDSEIRF